MKMKVIYALLLLLCCTLGASPNRNTRVCDAMRHCKASSLPVTAQDEPDTEAKAVIPAATGFLPGYSILFAN